MSAIYINLLKNISFGSFHAIVHLRDYSERNKKLMNLGFWEYRKLHNFLRKEG